MTKKLKIAMLFSSDPSKAGGVQEHVLHLSKELRDMGHKVDIYGPEKNILPFKNYHSIAKAVSLPIPNGNWANITVKNNDKHDIAEIIENKKYDIIHIHEPYVPFINWDVFNNTSAPKVATFHTAWNNDSVINVINPFLTLFKDTFSTNFKAAIFVSKIGKKRWQYLCKRNILQRVIYNAVDSNAFKPVKKKDDEITKLLFVGRIVNRKGLRYLLKSLKKIVATNKKIKLYIIGDGPEKESVNSYANNHGLKKYVNFMGEVYGNDLIKYYQKVDIFCAPYVDEAFGITILEALACGLPIVGFKNIAFDEILKGYPLSKLMVKSRDINKLTIALKYAIKNYRNDKTISNWSVARAWKFKWSETALSTEKLYNEVLGL